MAYEDYDLASIRQRCLEEFGIPSTASNNAIVDRRVNDAISWIVSRRKNWPWLRRETEIVVTGSTTGYFQLPSDCIKVLSVHRQDDASEVKQMRPIEFEVTKLNDAVVANVCMFYTVVPDPDRVVSNFYLRVWPFSGVEDTLTVRYYGDALKLVEDTNVPDIPRADRFAVYYASLWFVAQWQKATDMVAFYRDGALNELERMAKEYELTDDVTEDTEDISSDPDFIKGPNGFPQFGD